MTSPNTTADSYSDSALVCSGPDAGVARLIFSGNWRLDSQKPALRNARLEANALLSDPRTTNLVFAAKHLGEWDSSLLSVLVHLAQKARARNIPCNTEALPEGVRNLLQLALTVPPNRDAAREAKKAGFLAMLGHAVLAFPAQACGILNFIGDVTLALGRFCTGRAACSRRDILRQIQECGAEALPIASLISLLVGLILAFVGVVQLSMFGAEIYVSSLVAIGMTRIMGAIMTGIILAGRTGASFAAIIGTMQVNEEVDALLTSGVSPVDFLVLPRVIALSLMTPLLVLYADFMGMVGGFLVAVLAIGLNPVEYMTFTKIGFSLNNLWVGLAHGFVFGIVIAVTGCYQGLRCGRSAEAVGLATTAAVVFSIVGIVLSTAVLTIICNILKI